MRQLGSMDSESAARLRADDNLRKSLAENSLAASMLKKCKSPCFPADMSPELVERLERTLTRINETGTIDQAGLKKYLYDRRSDLKSAVAEIERWRDAPTLNAWMKYFNEGGSVKQVPPREDPKLLLEIAERSHDAGVKYGKSMAETEGLVSANFENPFERRGYYGQGFDDIRRKGASLDVGDIYIVEYKGGTATLAKGQMELDWVVGNIRKLFNEGGPSGQAWARILAKALREGRLKGVAYSTPMTSGQPKPTVSIGTWAYPSTKITLP
jgi:hypothetical protein